MLPLAGGSGRSGRAVALAVTMVGTLAGASVTFYIVTTVVVPCRHSRISGICESLTPTHPVHPPLIFITNYDN